MDADQLKYAWAARGSDAHEEREFLQHLYLLPDRSAAIAGDGFALHAVDVTNTVECAVDLQEDGKTILVGDAEAGQRAISIVEKTRNEMTTTGRIVMDAALLRRALLHMVPGTPVRLSILSREGVPAAMEIQATVEGEASWAMVMAMRDEFPSAHKWSPMKVKANDGKAKR
jgi:hypothetical protein